MATLSTTLTGSDVSDFQVTKTFTPTEKLEQNVILSNATQTIDFSFIDSPTVFTFQGDNEFVVSITAAANTIEFVVAGGSDNVFSYVTTAAFSATITDITVKEVNTVSTSIKVGIYNN